MADNDFTMDKATVRQIAEAAEEALQAVAERFGLSVERKGGKYDPSVGTFDARFLFSAGDAAAKEWTRWASLLDSRLTPEDFGRSFKSGGRTFVVSGANPRATKRPVLADEGGRTYAFPAAAVASALRAEDGA
jgi:hypothetical protein